MISICAALVSSGKVSMRNQDQGFIFLPSIMRHNWKKVNAIELLESNLVVLERLLPSTQVLIQSLKFRA